MVLGVYALYCLSSRFSRVGPTFLATFFFQCSLLAHPRELNGSWFPEHLPCFLGFVPLLLLFLSLTKLSPALLAEFPDTSSSMKPEETAPHFEPVMVASLETLPLSRGHLIVILCASAVVLYLDWRHVESKDWVFTILMRLVPRTLLEDDFCDLW